MDEPHDVDQALVSVGERCTRTLRLSRDEIADFARITGDTNPLHFDLRAAQRARHGEIIASGQQVSSMLISLASSYFSRADDQVSRELLCLNFNFAFKQPVFADQTLELSWQVATTEWHPRLRPRPRRPSRAVPATSLRQRGEQKRPLMTHASPVFAFA